MPASEWAVVWLAVAAISLALMVLMQVGAVIALVMVAKEAFKTLRGVQAQVAPLIDRGTRLMASASDVVDQAKGVVSRAGVEVERVKGAVDDTSEKVAHLRDSVRPVTANVAGVAAGVRTFWSVIRGRHDGRGRGDRVPITPDASHDVDLRNVMPVTPHGTAPSL